MLALEESDFKTARSAARWIEPMNAKLVRELPAANEWLYELKLDGYRVLAIRDGKTFHSSPATRTTCLSDFPR
jgi:ATP-dependent DNA ligase